MPNMNKETAYEVLVSQVHAPVFFGKLAAEWNYEPSSREEAIGVLKMAGKLRNAYEANQVKHAGDRRSFLASADEQLDDMLAAYGIGTSNSADQVKEAASQALQEPYIREAAAVFNDFLSQSQQN